MSWKRYLACSCSHGDYIDPEARKALLTFRDRWKPHTVLHLGDFVDMASLRRAAQSDANCKDRARSISEDVGAGVSFLSELSPKHILFGNHEARITELAGSPNAVLARAAQSILQEIQDCARAIKAKLYPYHIRSFVELGDVKFLHGFLHNVAAIRDTAETYGCRIVMGHIHRTGAERARTLQGVTGYGCGMLRDFQPDYAASKRQTLAWNQGFVFGEYNDSHCTVNVVERNYTQPWRLPL
jgi:predicted phosphodiesterase